MKLAAPVLHPDNPSQQLLRSGYALEYSVIRRMAEMGIESIYVEYPALDMLDRHLAVHLSPARQALYRDIKSSIAQSQKQTRPGVPYADYCSTTRDLIQTLLTQGQNPIYLEQMSRQGSDSVAHAAAVAHLSLLLGLRLENYIIAQRTRLPAHRAKDIVGLGVAGMLHDLGKSRLPESLWGYCDTSPPLREDELQEWRTHVHLGYDLIRNEVETTAAAAVYQHHQHFDGSGFPIRNNACTPDAKMAGSRIHIFARILAAANLYDRLSNPPRGRRRSNLQVIRLMEEHHRAWVDPKVMRVLEAVAPPYPPGCRIELADGTHAVVLEVNPARPLRPTVQRLGEDNWTLVGDAIDLGAEGAPAIREAAMAA